MCHFHESEIAFFFLLYREFRELCQLTSRKFFIARALLLSTQKVLSISKRNSHTSVRVAMKSQSCYKADIFNIFQSFACKILHDLELEK